MHCSTSRSLLAAAVLAAAQAVAAQAPSAAAAATPVVATRTANIAPANATPQAPMPFPAVASLKPIPSSVMAAYTNMPTLWPDADESKGPIALDSLLAAPLVTAGLAKVTAMVDPTLLALKPSIRNGYQSETLYQEDPVANCFWPTNQCHTPSLTTYKYLQPDVVACIDQSTLGLNYDDGPSGPTGQPSQGNETTLALGQKLQSMNLTATFFVTGGSSFYNPDALQALYAEGHELAVHTWTHAPMTSLTNQQIVAEILYTEAFIYALVGQRPRYFRPPYGDVDNRVRAIIGALGYESVMWQEAKDLGDQASATPPPVASMVALFDSWMTPQAGYIDLEHSLAAPVNQFAAAILDDVAARKAAGKFVPTIVPVGTCQKKSSYVPLGFALGDVAGVAANSTTPSSSSAAAGATMGSSSVAAGATPKSTAGPATPGASAANSGAVPPAGPAFLAGSVAAAAAAAAAAVLAF
ncbi:chitin deacetylase [Geranomyces variabilis]|uniref:Chitin deacetylase n=1 Tax=Geranomyces variabilis TaxID=109894 RepID=A0AAD5TJV9_9FUNG|nr:chitin deacetylase [Geranomyces variabilis]